jgi:hypothetical protein
VAAATPTTAPARRPRRTSSVVRGDTGRSVTVAGRVTEARTGEIFCPGEVSSELTSCGK